MNAYIVFDADQSGMCLDGVVDFGLLSYPNIYSDLDDAMRHIENDKQSVLEFSFVNPKEIIYALNCAVVCSYHRSFTIKAVSWYKKEPL